MNLYLTSTGLDGKVGHFFLDLIAKPPSRFSLAFIPTAADPYANKWFMEKDLENLKKIGFKISIVDLKNNPGLIKKDLENSQIIYVGGGNTFYLLHWARASGLDQYLRGLLEGNRHYIGASAGSILVGPDIAISGWDPGWDTNDVGLTNTIGLNLVPFVISPHFIENKRPILEKHLSSINYQILPITDSQAIYWHHNQWQLVGEGELVKL
jgi:dipeptidase E